MKEVCGTTLEDLYGKHGKKYLKPIKVGNQYWYHFPTHLYPYKQPLKIEITYIRSGYYFFNFPDYPQLPEETFHRNSVMPKFLIVAELDPERDLREVWGDLLTKDIQFDNTLTKIINWNEEN